MFRSTPPGDDERSYEMRRAELAEDLRRAGYGTSPFLTSLEQLTGGPRPASRDSRGDSREERNSSGEDNEIKEFKVKQIVSSSLYSWAVLRIWIQRIRDFSSTLIRIPEELNIRKAYLYFLREDFFIC